MLLLTHLIKYVGEAASPMCNKLHIITIEENQIIVLLPRVIEGKVRFLLEDRNHDK